MASQIFENQYIVNSFYAVKPDGSAYTADAAGYITVKEGDEIVFKDLYEDKHVEINTITFTTKGTALKVQINDNALYPFYVPAGGTKGIQYMRVYKLKALCNCTFYFEALV